MNVLRSRVHTRMVKILSGDGLCVVQSLLLLLLMVILLMPSQAEAVIYKCVSEEGAMTFSDRQCQGVSRETINLRVKQPMRQPVQDAELKQKKAKVPVSGNALTNDQANDKANRQQTAATKTLSDAEQCQQIKAKFNNLKTQLSEGYSVQRKKNFQAQLKLLKGYIRKVC